MAECPMQAAQEQQLDSISINITINTHEGYVGFTHRMDVFMLA